MEGNTNVKFKLGNYKEIVKSICVIVPHFMEARTRHNMGTERKRLESIQNVILLRDKWIDNMRIECSGKMWRRMTVVGHILRYSDN